MKKLLVLILIFFTLNTTAIAQKSTGDVITAIENSFWGYDYKSESDTKRIERIEKHIYGETKSGNTKTRLENIQNDTGIIVQETQPQSAVKNDINKTVSDNTNNTAGMNQNLKEDSSVDYPIVDKMEEEVLKTTYKDENIYNRLNRLEEKVFNKTSNEDLNTRVNKLASAIVPVRKSYETQSYSRGSNTGNYYNNNNFDAIDNQSFNFQLAVLEEDIFKNSYNNENISNRLSRLEQKLFNRTFTNDADSERLQRIMVAYDAKMNSYKYENNRKMQNMATMSQIGGILLMILAILL